MPPEDDAASTSSKPVASRTGAAAATKPAPAGTGQPSGDLGGKAVNKDYCFRHARMYEGWECPLCAREKAAGTGPTGPSHAAAGSGGSARSSTFGAPPGAPAPSGGGLVTPEAKAASRARSDDASHLLDSGAVAEALEAVDRALELDRTNLHAYVVGSRAAERIGDFGRQEDLLEEAARLLRGSEHRHVARWYHDLLRGTRDAAMARPIVASFIAAGPWSPPDASAMIRALVTRGLAGEALRLLESIEPQHRSLSICAYAAQLTARAFSMSDPDVDAYLARVPIDERDRVLAEFRAMCEDGTFPVSTLMLIRDALRARYRVWAPEIGQAHEATARRAAAAKLHPLTVKPAMSMALWVGGGTLALAIVVALAVGGGGLLILTGFLLAVAGAVGGFVYGREAELQRRLPAILPALIEEASRDEQNKWLVVFDDQSPVFTAAAASEPQPTATEAPDTHAAQEPAGPPQPPGESSGVPGQAATAPDPQAPPGEKGS